MKNELTTMRISIGILAKDEEKNIAKTLGNLFEQSVFTNHYDTVQFITWELIIVLNGCIDDTEGVVTNFIREHAIEHKLSCKIISIKTPGKSNAWNLFVHDYSNPKTEYFVMLDADIEFGSCDTIFNSLNLLISNPKYKVVVDTPLKDFVKKKKHNLIEFFSLRYSRQTLDKLPAIAGSFYCAHASILRQIWMPPGLAGEDGFLKAMIVTDLFRRNCDFSLIGRADNAVHYYEGLSCIKKIFHHEVRMFIGTALNCYLCWDFLLFATDPNGPGAGELIHSQLERDPGWYQKLMSNSIQNRGWWVLPKGMVTRNLASLKWQPWQGFPLRLILSLLVTAMRLPVAIVANHKLKKGAVGFW